MNKLNLNEDLKRYKAEQEEKARIEAEEAARVLEEERKFNIENDVRTESGSIAKVGGRPPGSKNKTTLFKEAMRQGFEEVLEKEGLKVFLATCQRAVGTPVRNGDGELLKDENGNQVYEGGSDSASKIIMDRIVPVADVDKLHGKEKYSININVSGLKAEVEVMDGEYEIEDN